MSIFDYNSTGGLFWLGIGIFLAYVAYAMIRGGLFSRRDAKHALEKTRLKLEEVEVQIAKQEEAIERIGQ